MVGLVLGVGRERTGIGDGGLVARDDVGHERLAYLPLGIGDGVPGEEVRGILEAAHPRELRVQAQSIEEAGQVERRGDQPVDQEDGPWGGEDALGGARREVERIVGPLQIEDHVLAGAAQTGERRAYLLGLGQGEARHVAGAKEDTGGLGVPPGLIEEADEIEEAVSARAKEVHPGVSREEVVQIQERQAHASGDGGVARGGEAKLQASGGAPRGGRHARSRQAQVGQIDAEPHLDAVGPGRSVPAVRTGQEQVQARENPSVDGPAELARGAEDRGVPSPAPGGPEGQAPAPDPGPQARSVGGDERTGGEVSDREGVGEVSPGPARHREVVGREPITTRAP